MGAGHGGLSRARRGAGARRTGRGHREHSGGGGGGTAGTAGTAGAGSSGNRSARGASAGELLRVVHRVRANDCIGGRLFR